MSQQQAAAPGPGSLVWRTAGDWMQMLGGGRALILQVAHPIVAAGVAEHSDYESDPWRRLVGTLDLYLAVIFGTRNESPAEAGQRLRNMHRDIKGVRPDGRRYHALQPDAFFWVHATLLDTMVEMRRRFGRPLSLPERERFYAEMCAVGRLYGLRDRDMRPDWLSFRAYFERMVDEDLEDSELLQKVIRSIARPAKPPVLPVPDTIWDVASRPAAELAWLTTVGSLPRVLRERLGLTWSVEREVLLRAHQEAIRRVWPRLPERVRLMPPAFAARRRAAAAA